MKTELVKGFKDFEGEEAWKKAEIKKILVETFEKYGFNPLETPVIEYEDFVKGDKSQNEDEVISDIFKLQDKGKRNLALRYEFTFQLKRIMQNKKLPFKRYQMGPIFRDEPVTGNRWRQFTQADVDVVGSQGVKDEAETLALVSEILNKLGIDFKIYLGNRKLLNEILKEKNVKENKKVIKIIDKLDKKPEKEIKEELKKFECEEIIQEFKEKEEYFEKYKAYSEIKELKEILKNYNLEKFVEFSPSLARGLSYYNGNIWEIKTKEMKETITAGGSYEFNNTQCTGISLGLERISKLSKIEIKRNSVLIVSLNEDKQAIKIAQKLRKQGARVSIYYGKPSKALSYADSYNMQQVIFVGAQEVKQKKFKVKNMNTGKEKFLTLNKINKKNLIVQRKKGKKFSKRT